MVYKMKNIKDNIKEKVLFYYREIKDRQTELENRYLIMLKISRAVKLNKWILYLYFGVVAMTCIQFCL